MKWKELTLKERKQIYDAVRAENPNASYLDIKAQFDLPSYGDGEDDVAASYSLPEVSIYPNNRFGDIARNQGLQTARNWQAVKDATTEGINNFVWDPRTQFMLSVLPMANEFDAAGSILASPAMEPVVKPITNAIGRAVTTVGNKVKGAVKETKNVVNRLTAPKSSLKDVKPYAGDWDELYKQRLINGGFDKLHIYEDDLLIRYPYLGKNYNEFNGVVKARNYILRERAKEMKPPLQDNAWYSHFDRSITDPGKGKSLEANKKHHLVTAHERGHMVDYAAGDITGDNTLPNYHIPGTDEKAIDSGLLDYFARRGNTELKSRVGQLRNYLGIDNAARDLTVDEWNYLRRNYVPQVGYDNNMQEMFRFVKDPETFLNWINPKVPAIVGATAVGAAAANASDNEEVPAYQDGKSSSEDWRKPVKSNVAHNEQFVTDAKKVLGGLNKTVGKAATGASLLTMGGWNLLRTLGVGKGSAYRLWAAKNALAGAKAGTAADIGDFIEDPSINGAVQLMLDKIAIKDYLAKGTKGLINTSSLADINDLIEDIPNNSKGKQEFVFDPIKAFEEAEKAQTYDGGTLPNVDVFPAYQDGKGSDDKLPASLGYTPGTQEYYERAARISGRAETVQPEAYLTPAGYVKDAINIGEDLANGDYAGAAFDAAANAIPYGVGKAWKSLRRGRTAARSQEFTPTTTKPRRLKKKRTEADYDAEFAEYMRRARNADKYNEEITQTINDAVNPSEKTAQLINEVDATYGTDYKGAYNKIANKDKQGRSKYVEMTPLEDGILGTTSMKDANGRFSQNVDDYKMKLDLDEYVPGTGNHELGHISDGLAGSNKVNNFEAGGSDVVNPYLNYLADSRNTYSSAELRRMGSRVSPQMRDYLLNPTESKSHMLTLKRSMVRNGYLKSWDEPLTQEMVENYFKDHHTTTAVKQQYSLYKNKQSFVDRLNKLVPMEYAAPVGMATAAGSKKNQSKKKK